MESEREGAFRVQCSSTGGRLLSMTVTGPFGKSYNLTANIQTVGDPQGLGDDMFTASTSVLSETMNGDVYQCHATNGVPTTLKGCLDNCAVWVFAELLLYFPYRYCTRAGINHRA